MKFLGSINVCGKIFTCVISGSLLFKHIMSMKASFVYNLTSGVFMQLFIEVGAT